jgi:hypothetical protein
MIPVLLAFALQLMLLTCGWLFYGYMRTQKEKYEALKYKADKYDSMMREEQTRKIYESIVGGVKASPVEKAPKPPVAEKRIKCIDGSAHSFSESQAQNSRMFPSGTAKLFCSRCGETRFV